MFLRFTFANHRSLRDEVELSFVADGGNEFARQAPGLSGVSVLPVAAIYGANASGKSSVLNAVAFLSEAVENSQRLWNPDAAPPRQPFALDPRSAKAPSHFEVEAIVEGIRMAYGFELDDSGVTKEWIYAWPNGRRQAWLERTGSSFSIARTMPGEKRAIRALTRPNSLFLSAAAQNNQEHLMPLYRKLTSGISLPRTPSRDSLELALQASIRAIRDDRHDQIIELLRLADLGIDDVIDNGARAGWNQQNLFDMPVDTVHPDRARSAQREPTGRRKSREIGPTLLPAEVKPPHPEAIARRIRNVALLKQYRRREQFKASDIGFRHAGNRTVTLRVDQESSGTISWFALAGQLLDVCGSGGLLCFDELDATLHPSLVAEVTGLFQDPSTNLNGAQLLAAGHDTTILSTSTDGHLSRDQIWLTEKANDGATCLIPLSDFAPRHGQNLETAYRQGRFGGLPTIGAEEFASVLAPLRALA